MLELGERQRWVRTPLPTPSSLRGGEQTPWSFFLPCRLLSVPPRGQTRSEPEHEGPEWCSPLGAAPRTWGRGEGSRGGWSLGSSADKAGL